MRTLTYLSTLLVITVLLVGAVAIPSNSASAVSQITAAQNGDWNTGSTWVGGLVPASSDIKIIPNGITVTVSTSVTNTGGIIIKGGGVLTNAGTINNNAHGTIFNDCLLYTSDAADE